MMVEGAATDSSIGDGSMMDHDPQDKHPRSIWMGIYLRRHVFRAIIIAVTLVAMQQLLLLFRPLLLAKLPPKVGVKKRPGRSRARPIRLADLMDLNDDNLGVDEVVNETAQEAMKSRRHILELLQLAGLQIDDDLLHQLPRWSEVTDLYGTEPVFVGLETCADFRRKIPERGRFIGVGGQMNAGTNALAKYMHDNLWIPANHFSRGVLGSLPWNKHGWTALRDVYRFAPPADVSTVLPIVIIRDPYFWMRSMCESPYTMEWKHSEDRCPNLVKEEALNEDTMVESFGNPVQILWGVNFGRSWQSMAHVWSEWYREYYEADFPRLMIRFEDLLFRTPEVLDQIRQCAGADWRNKYFAFTTRAMKRGEYYEKIKPQSNMLSAIIKNGQDRGSRRRSNMTDADLVYARQFLDSELMDTFRYQHPAEGWT